MIHCRECPYWHAQSSDNGMGTCSGLPGAMEVNAGAFGAADLEFLTPDWWYCPIPQTERIVSRGDESKAKNGNSKPL